MSIKQKAEKLSYTEKYFRFEVLLLFSLIEVLFYDSHSVFLPFIAIVEYCFILATIFLNFKLGIAYFVSFILLSMSNWSYVIQEELPNTFWGIRLFGLSFNILFSFFLFLLCVFKYKINLKSLLYCFDLKYFFFFIIYITVIGIISVTFSINYIDNFVKDTSVYLPFFFYVVYLHFIDDLILIKIFRWGFLLTVITMLLSFLTKINFTYGEGFVFVLMNSFAYLVIFSIFFLKKYFSRTEFYFLLFSIVFLLISGKLFVGGKAIIIYIFSIIWYFYINKNFRLYSILFVLFFYLFSDLLILFFNNQFNNEILFYYKFSQVYDSIFDFDLSAIASSPTSMGNLIAEGQTTFKFLISNPLFFLFGKGFGGGIPDVFGYFAPLAGPGTGYTYNDVLRNDFFRMHLPLFEIFIKGGIVTVVIYIYILFRSIREKNIISFIYFIILFTVFFNSKEMMLLTLLFMKLSNIYKNLEIKIAIK